MPKLPVSAPQNQFFDSQTITSDNLTLEQNYNNQIQASIRANHFGSGVLLNSLVPNVIFNSALVQNVADGTALYPQNQPSDPNNGVQLSITLSNSLAAGNRTVKVLIVGLDFQDNLQYNTFTFSVNETQVCPQHYTQVLLIVLNDFAGPTSQSFRLGGQLVIQEVGGFILSRDPIMTEQVAQPNLFFRDFVIPGGISPLTFLANSLPNYNVGSLNITPNYLLLQSLVQNDVSSQIGQKFLATTDNIQKITLLLSVFNNITPSDLVWDGDLLVSIYPLQSVVQCYTDIVPAGPINYDPSNIPLAQLSIDYGSLQASGTVLNGVPQPVDFILSNTTVANGSSITVGSYYALTIKRAGSADTCQIQVAVGANTSSTQWETLFNGNVWTDIPAQSLWFEVWADAAKVSDGMAYDDGAGMVIPKNQINATTGLTEDYSLGQLSFERNDVFSALAQADTVASVPVQDPRTGNPIFSQQQYEPNISLLNPPALASIQGVSDPLIIGTITDQNIKSYNLSTATLNSDFHEYGFVNNEIVIKVITDQTDGYRYDTSIIDLAALVVAGKANGAKITPNIANPSVFYRIAKAEYLTLVYGDVNMDGVVDENDIPLAEALVGQNINSMPSWQEYEDQTTDFINDGPLVWQVVNPNTMVVVASGTDAFLTVEPVETLAILHSASANFSSIVSLNTYVVVLSGSTISPGNNGTFVIQSLIDSNDIVIQKEFYTSDTILQIMCANVSNSGVVSTTDTTAITNYATVVQPFPATTLPGLRVGTSFNAIRLSLEEFVDRADDYPSNASNRSTTLHPLPDIFLDGYNDFAGQDLETDPLPFSVVQQLVWYDTSIVSNSAPRLVEQIFTNQVSSDGYTTDVPSCVLTTITDETFPQPPVFNPGSNDLLIPNNLIMNQGQIVNPDGYYWRGDIEVCSLLIEVPQINFDGYNSVNLFTDLVCDYSGSGRTRLGREALRFSDCSYVPLTAIQNNQVRFTASMQSFSQQIFETDSGGLSGLVIDSNMGVYLDPMTGLLTLSFNNTYNDPVDQTATTKVLITIYLKRGGFSNPQQIYIDSAMAQGWLGLS